ncbi:MAG: aerotolerance regulator BatA, partial [Muribaculaceae bacterium]|nr:aerotolerance regulator BatA [Muribaculaceae bacterium]
LKGIADLTNGKYFRATDSKMLADIFAEIDSLEKTTLDVSKFTYTEEDFMPWILLALCAISLRLLLRYTVLRRIP